MLTIADLSSNNSGTQRTIAINYCDGTIIKATEGKSYVNPYNKQDAQKVVKAGKLLGFYHYARPENNTAEEEAINFLKCVRPYLGRAILALDWEGNALKCDPQWARDWLDYVYQMTGVRPLLYCSEAFLKNVGSKVVSGNYGLWVAKYSKNTPKIAPWKFKALWQYTSNPYDMSHFYGDSEAWQAYARRSNDE